MGARGYLIMLSLEGTPDDNKARMRYNCTSVAALAGTEIGDNYTFFTFVREPRACFTAGAIEVMGRSFSGNYLFRPVPRPPAFFNLQCNESTRYLSTFVSDVVAGNNVFGQGVHIWPQVLKISTGIGRLDFVGTLENLADDIAKLFREHLKIDSARIMNISAWSSRRVNFNKQGRPLHSNMDRCGAQISPSEAELEKVRPAVCDLMAVDYECFGSEYYSPCALRL